MSLNDIASSFFVQTETQALYPDLTDTAGFVNSVYSNFLGLTPDTDGFNYWVQQIDTNAVINSIFILAIINGAKAESGSAADVAHITGKANLGTYYSVTKGMSNVENAKTAMALYDGTAASTTNAKNVIDNFYAAAVNSDSGQLLIGLENVIADPFAIV